jgi:hypothetical protein
MSEQLFSLIHVGPQGGFKSSRKHSTSLENLETIVKDISVANRKRLIIYFHGGLVDEKSGIESAIKVNQELKHQDHYIISFIWETGLGDTLKDNLTDIFKSKQGKRLLKWVIRAVTKKLAFGTLKGGSGQGVSIEDIEKELENLKPFADFDTKGTVNTRSAKVNIASEADKEELEQDLREEIEDYYFNKNENEDEWFDGAPSNVSTDLTKEESDTKNKGFGFYGVAKAVVKVAWRVLKRYRANRDHGLHATVVEEICRAYYISNAGQWVWGQMKEKGQQMWQEGNVGGEFIKLLKNLVPNQKVDLIGHSAGAICISHFLDVNNADLNTIEIDNLFLLAPAARSELFFQKIVKPQQGGQNRFNNFRMFTMNDELERDDSLVKLIPQLYPSSLLYFISGVLEEESDAPLSGLIRHQKHSVVYTNPMFDSIDKFLQIDGRLVTSKSSTDASPGFRTSAITHGAFDDDDLTLSSIKHCLLEGQL